MRRQTYEAIAMPISKPQTSVPIRTPIHAPNDSIVEVRSSTRVCVVDKSCGKVDDGRELEEFVSKVPVVLDVLKVDRVVDAVVVVVVVVVIVVAVVVGVEIVQFDERVSQEGHPPMIQHGAVTFLTGLQKPFNVVQPARFL